MRRQRRGVITRITMKEAAALIYLIINSFFDIRTKTIPLLPSILFGFAGILLSIFLFKRSIPELLCALIPGILLTAFSFITRGGIGLGDGLSVIVVSLYISFSSVIPFLCLSVFISSIYALFLFGIKRNRSAEFPFIPFLAAGLASYLMISKIFSA